MTYPPQPGPGPYGQQPQPYPPQQPGYGYPQQQQPYPQQGQQPYPPHQQPQPPYGGYPGGSPQGMPPQGVPPQNASGGAKKAFHVARNILIVVVAGGALAGLAFGWFESDAKAIAVGECMDNKGSTISPDMETVDCGASAAEFKVSEVHDNATDMTLCDATKYVAYTETSGSRKSKSSVVLCLTPLGKAG